MFKINIFKYMSGIFLRDQHKSKILFLHTYTPYAASVYKIQKT